MKRKLYQHIASMCDAWNRCCKEDNHIWSERHGDNVEYLAKNFLPSGSGIDSGCKVDFGKTTGEKLVINSSFHVMNEHGYYDGWIDFQVIITPSLVFDYHIDIRGRFGKHQDLKDYLVDTFRYHLDRVIEHKFENDESVFKEVK
jgi:hypothetical protein